MLFFSFFKTLVDQEVVVELKNDIEIRGTLKSVDQFLNLKLYNVSTVNETKYPHLQAVKTLFVRGSTVRYVHLSASSVDCTLLQDASRRGMLSELYSVPTRWENLRNDTNSLQRRWFKQANRFEPLYETAVSQMCILKFCTISNPSQENKFENVGPKKYVKQLFMSLLASLKH